VNAGLSEHGRRHPATTGCSAERRWGTRLGSRGRAVASAAEQRADWGEPRSRRYPGERTPLSPPPAQPDHIGSIKPLVNPVGRVHTVHHGHRPRSKFRDSADLGFSAQGPSGRSDGMFGSTRPTARAVPSNLCGGAPLNQLFPGSVYMTFGDSRRLTMRTTRTAASISGNSCWRHDSAEEVEPE
jgi:hypothetical protein